MAKKRGKNNSVDVIKSENKMTEEDRKKVVSSLQWLVEDIAKPKTETPPLPKSSQEKKKKLTTPVPQKEINGFIKLDRQTEYYIRILSLSEQAVYRILYKKSYGWKKDLCSIGYARLSKECNCSKDTVKRALKRLINRGWIEPLETSYSSPTVYRVYLPKSVVKNIQENNGLSKDIEMYTGSKLHTVGKMHTGSKLHTPQVANCIQGGSKMHTGSKPTTSHNSLDYKEIETPKSPESLPIEYIIEYDRTLSPIVYNLYYSIGQTKVSKSKLEKGERVLKGLLKEGYTLEEVKFSLEELKKIPDVKNIALLKDTISQSVAKLDRKKKEEEFRKAQEQKQKQDLVQQNIQELKQKAVTERINGLNPRERQELTEKAKELTNDQQNLPFYDKIVWAKEREIISQEMSKSTPQEKEVVKQLGIPLVKIP